MKDPGPPPARSRWMLWFGICAWPQRWRKPPPASGHHKLQLPLPAPSPPSQGTTAAEMAPLLQAPSQHCRGGTAAAMHVDNIHSNNSSGNQAHLPAGAGSEEPRPKSRTSHTFCTFPPSMQISAGGGNQNPRREYGSKEEAVLRCSSSYFIRVAQNQ